MDGLVKERQSWLLLWLGANSTEIFQTETRQNRHQVSFSFSRQNSWIAAWEVDGFSLHFLGEHLPASVYVCRLFGFRVEP